jgi:NAD-dependent dihydropyrimidine dehydrogenase PreA subunit
LVQIRIDYAKCINEKDKICLELCPVSIFVFEKGSKPKTVKAEKCIMCKTCIVNCPGQAIEILV